MKAAKTVLIWLILVILLVFAAGAYFYRTGRLTQLGSTNTPQSPAATPDNSVLAGPVSAVSPSSITITKQDGTSATVVIASTTQVILSGQDGQHGTLKSVSDIAAGMMVLITSDQSGAPAQSILIVSPPPKQ